MNPVTVTQDLSIISLVLHASLLAQAVMALLLVMSLFSWTYIFRKHLALRAARSQTGNLRARLLGRRRSPGAL